MLRRALLLTLAVVACQAAPTVDVQLSNHIKVADYDSAVSLSKELVRKGKGDIISKVTEKLVEEGQRNLLDYAYHLWNRDAKDIVKDYLPLEVRIVVGQHAVKLISNKDNMVLKLGVKIDSDGDRVAYGDSNHMIGDRMAWKFIPVPGSQLHFLIYNPQTNQYLKLGSSIDSDKDHAVYGDSKSDSYRHQFYLLPVRDNGELLYYIFNREYQQALKMSVAVDSYGDRQVFSESGSVLGQPETFGWKVKPI